MFGEGLAHGVVRLAVSGLLFDPYREAVAGQGLYFSLFASGLHRNPYSHGLYSTLFIG